MFEFLQDKENALNILRDDHNKVKDLFDRFKNSSRSQKRKIVTDTIHELKIHAAIEEEIFYPTIRPYVEKRAMNEANEEHHIAKVLIAELERMDGTEEHFDAKYTVLAENVRHHIKEEEGLIFTMVDNADVDLDALGRKILAKKAELMKKGVPEFAEEKMIALIKGKSDSPARTAELHDMAAHKQKKRG